jgi:hypothetical protein
MSYTQLSDEQLKQALEILESGLLHGRGHEQEFRNKIDALRAEQLDAADTG